MTNYHDQPAEPDHEFVTAITLLEIAVFDLLNNGSNPETVRDLMENAIRMAEGLEDEDRG